MDILTRILWVITFVFLMFSLKKDRKKTLGSMKMAKGMMGGMIGDIVGILFLIGLLLTFIPPETIKSLLGQSNSVISTVLAAITGSVTLIPAFVAFPLVASLVDAGASRVPIVAFLTTLTMVGIVTFPLERKEFGFNCSLLS